MSTTVNLHFKYTEEEVVSALRTYMMRSPRLVISLFYFLFLLLWGLYMATMGDGLTGLAVFLLTAGGVTLNFYLSAFLRLPRRRFRGDPKFQDEQFIQFSEEGIYLKTARIESKLQWSVYTRFLETSKFFLLVYGENMLTIIPKRVFHSAVQQATFRDILQSKLPTGPTRRQLDQPKSERSNVREQWERPAREYVPPVEPPDWR